jgi:EspA/EspE family
VSALDGFRSIWSQANATVGEGAPSDGSQFDQSGRLLGLQDDVRSARPDDAWTGSAANTYAEANSRHERAIGGIASLDKRLAAEVDRSASVVTAGRRDLESVRQWVNDAAARVPNTTAGERMLYPVISKGSSDIQDIINRSHGDLSSIGERIRALSGEYQALGDGDEGGKGGRQLPDDWRKPKVPDTTLDLDDIVRKPPFVPGDQSTYGPPNSIELGPGTWLPRNDYPGVAPSPPKAPLDYRDIKVLPPYDPKNPKSLRPRDYMELVPGSGAWVPDPHAPGFVPHPPEVPVDMATAQILNEGDKIPSGMIELYPGSRIAIPDPNLGAPR